MVMSTTDPAAVKLGRRIASLGKRVDTDVGITVLLLAGSE